MEIITDGQLVERTLLGDDASFEILFERYSEGLLGWLRSRTSDLALSDDILQEAFVKAFLNLEKFDAKYSFAAWIRKIAQNLLIDHSRRAENRPKESASNLEVASETPNPEESFMGVEDNERLSCALNKLTPAYRKIIELRFFRDMSYEQISEKLSLPMGTVKTQVHRARKAFIDILGDF